VVILIGCEQGAAVSELSLIAGVDASNVSLRYDAARLKLKTDRKLAFAKSQTEAYTSQKSHNRRRDAGFCDTCV